MQIYKHLYVYITRYPCPNVSKMSTCVCVRMNLCAIALCSFFCLQICQKVSVFKCIPVQICQCPNMSNMSLNGFVSQRSVRIGNEQHIYCSMGTYTQRSQYWQILLVTQVLIQCILASRENNIKPSQEFESYLQNIIVCRIYNIYLQIKLEILCIFCDDTS